MLVSGEPPNWVFSMFVFLGFLLVTIPLPWHLEAWNTGTCLYMVWTGIGCLNLFINSVVWNGNAINWAPVWCDISTKLMIGVAVAIPAASLCINRRLYHIASVQTVTITRAEKRRQVMIDLAIGLGIPFLEMILHVIVQGHRANIFEDVGCYPATFNTPPTYALVTTWPLVIGTVSAVYCILTIRAFSRRRSQFKELLSANKNLSSGRYFRLMALAAVELLCTIPLSSYAIFLNVSANDISPWRGWADAHFDFNRFDQYPAFIWKQDKLTVVSLELSRWLLVVCAFIFFGFFGFADEARKNYRIAINSVAKRVGYSTASMSSGLNSSSGGTKGTSSFGRNLPVFVTRHTEQKRDSMVSFDGKLTNVSVSIADYGAFDDIKETPYSPSASSASSRSTASLPSSPDNEDTSHSHILNIPLPPSLVHPELAHSIDIESAPRHDADAPTPARSPRPDSLDVV